MFDKVFGHDRNKEILSRMLAKDSLHHGLCFHGPAGIGKRLLARELAKAMLCNTRDGVGDCSHCHKMDNGTHPDYLEIEPDGKEIKVDQIRQISENLHYRPFEGRARFIVLDRVETMRDAAANAFLKSLEEPPEYVYFILICSDLKALLATIRSRCQKIPFQSLTDQDKANILTTRFSHDPDVARNLAAISFRQLETDAEALQIFHEDMKRILGYLNAMFEAGHGVDLLADTVRDKEAYPRFYDHLTATLRECALTSAGLQGAPLFEPYREHLAKLLPRCEPGEWRNFWEETVRLKGLQVMNVNTSLWFNSAGVSALGGLERSRQANRRQTNR